MYRISEERPDRDYWTQIPNMIDDLDISPYARTLYVHIKRVAGNDGSCWQSTRTLATACRMSTGAVSKAKQELAQQKLITVEVCKLENGKLYHDIRIVDVWDENHAHFANRSRSDQKECSPDEQEPLRSPREGLRSAYELARSPSETKKNPLRRTHEEEPLHKSPKKVASSGTRGRALEVDDRTLAFAINNTRKRGAKLYCNMCKAVEGMYHSCEGYRYVPFEYLAN